MVRGEFATLRVKFASEHPARSRALFFFNLQVLIHPTGGSKYCKPWDFGPFLFYDVARTQATAGDIMSVVKG